MNPAIDVNFTEMYLDSLLRKATFLRKFPYRQYQIDDWMIMIERKSIADLEGTWLKEA